MVRRMGSACDCTRCLLQKVRDVAQFDQEVDEYQPRFQHPMNLLVESRASPPGRPTAAGETQSLHPNDFPEKWCVVWDQLPIVPAACCKSCSTLPPLPPEAPSCPT